MRLYLDTNVLVTLLTNQSDRCDEDTVELLSDYSNKLYTSPICVHELIYLRQTGKVSTGKEWKNDEDVVHRLSEFGVEILPITAKHLRKEEELPLVDRHRDPLDRLIIAQAIADRATLVSSDLQFPKYCKYGLELHQNK